MKERETIHILIGILVLALVMALSPAISGDFSFIGKAIVFSIILIGINISAKKFVAHLLDSDIEHEIWQWGRFGFKPGWHLKKTIPMGIILPIILSIYSLGAIKLLTPLTYETRALKKRAAKRFGPFSFTEMTDWHNALVGAAGIIAILLVAFISYWYAGLETLSKFATFYAFSNMIPFSKLDGSQIFFGSRVLWATLSIITLIFTAYAFALV